jgi:hypothetical protein
MISYYISPKSKRELEKTLKDFANKSKIGVAETIAVIGSNVAKELARGVQPFGLTSGVGAKFSVGVIKQIRKAARHSEKTGYEGGIEQVHTKYRNSQGAVMVYHPPKFQPKRKKIDKADISSQARKKVKEIGKGKAGWIASGESIDSPLLKTKKGKFKRIKGVSYWIRRHVTSSVGSSVFQKRWGLNSGLLLTNKVDYAYASGQTNHKQVNPSIKTGYMRSISAVKRLLKKLQ